MEKTALIIGVEGQDGILLSHFLLAKGYKVFGIGKGNGKAIIKFPLKIVKKWKWKEPGFNISIE